MSEEAVPLSSQEDAFALAVIEFGGNLGAAYRAAFGKQVANPVPKAQDLINRPEVALRIKRIADATQEHAMISLGSHLLQLAKIRDKSVKLGDMRTGLAAEVKRGEVAGFYKDKAVSPADNRQVHIHLPAPSPTGMEDWARQYGDTEPVIIENPT